MPSFGDSIFLFVLALILFGPKKLPELARQLGKLMAEFRRASNEFRVQMEDELRVADQAEKQKQIAAIEAAAPVPILHSEPAPTDTTEPAISPAESAFPDSIPEVVPDHSIAPPPPAPLPIAAQGEIRIMPPETGLPAPRRSSLSALIDAVPRAEAPIEQTPEPITANEEALHG